MKLFRLIVILLSASCLMSCEKSSPTEKVKIRNEELRMNQPQSQHFQHGNNGHRQLSEEAKQELRKRRLREAKQELRKAERGLAKPGWGDRRGWPSGSSPEWEEQQDRVRELKKTIRGRSQRDIQRKVEEMKKAEQKRSKWGKL